MRILFNFLVDPHILNSDKLQSMAFAHADCRLHVGLHGGLVGFNISQVIAGIALRLACLQLAIASGNRNNTIFS